MSDIVSQVKEMDDSEARDVRLIECLEKAKMLIEYADEDIITLARSHRYSDKHDIDSAEFCSIAKVCRHFWVDTDFVALEAPISNLIVKAQIINDPSTLLPRSDSQGQTIYLLNFDSFNLSKSQHIAVAMLLVPNISERYLLPPNQRLIVVSTLAGWVYNQNELRKVQIATRHMFFEGVGAQRIFDSTT